MNPMDLFFVAVFSSIIALCISSMILDHRQQHHELRIEASSKPEPVR